MAATAQWIDIPFRLESPYGAIDLNTSSGDRYLLVPSGCDMGAELRVTKENIPQADGSILHRRWFAGYECRLTIMPWVNDVPACDNDLVRMIDMLSGICWSLREAGDNQGRLKWTPTGKPMRMLDDIRLLERLTVATDETGLVTCTFSVDTPYPYAQDFTQITTALPGVATNTGTAEYWPVFKIYGPTDAFTLTNTTTGESIIYDKNLPGGISVPGGGGYVEIDCFRNTAYINGFVLDAKGSIDVVNSDFFPIVVGSNTLTLSGAPSGDMLWAAAWA